MSVTRRDFASLLLRSLAAVSVLSMVGCSKLGLGEPETKKYAGGGPIPEAGEEIPEKSPPRSKSKRR